MEKEAANFLVNKVGDLYVSAYINHLVCYDRVQMAPHAIVPDFHTVNLPAGRQIVDSSGLSLSAEAIFEVKTMMVCKSCYKYNTTIIMPINRHARKVCNEYLCKFKRLDRIYAPETVGANGAGMGPFEAAQRQFLEA